MIDFRYHLVSLIAVFLALSVGIVLGAGPLRDTIGDTLTGQVEDLRADRDRLRAQFEAAEIDVTERTTYLEESAPVLLEGTLTDRDVALVTLPGTSSDDVEEIRDRLALAGAEVVGEVAVTEAWTDPDTESFRQTFAGQLLGYLADPPDEDAGTGAIFGAAIAQALTGGGGPDDADTLMDLLTSAESPLVTVTAEPTGAAESTVLVGPPPAEVPAEDADPEQTEAAAAVLATHVRLADALAAAGPSVTVGSAVSDLDLVTAVRADDDAAGRVTSVDSVGEVTAAISTPLALAVSISGGSDAYGFGMGAEAPVPPRVELTPPGEVDGAGDTPDEETTGPGTPGQTATPAPTAEPGAEETTDGGA